MDIVENTQAKVETPSKLSDMVGPSVLEIDPVKHVRRSNERMIHGETFEEWGLRQNYVHQILGQNDGFTVGPTGAFPFHAIPLNAVVQNNTLLRKLFKQYRSFRYSELHVRVTVSDPKGLVGGLHVGWFPFVDWFDKNPLETITALAGADPDQWFQWYANFSRNVHLQPFGSSQDIHFSIPWTYKSPQLYCYPYIALDNSEPELRSAWGDPVLWWWQLPGVTSVVDNPLPSYLKIFMNIEGLTFFGPMENQIENEAQSGLEPLVIAEVAGSIATAVGVEAAGSSFLGAALDKTEMEEESIQGTYDKPDTVQLAYLGDISSVDFTDTTPIFMSYLSTEPYNRDGAKANIHEFLRRPQYIGTFTDSFTLNSNPMSFVQDRLSTWFRFFGMLNRYYRGTINVHFIVMGHPLVEVEFIGTVTFPGSAPTPDSQIALMYDVHTSIFAGSKCIHMQLPFVSVKDYEPVVDAYPYAAQDPGVSSINAGIRVVSFTTPLQPLIPCAVYVSAAPDFAFYGPRPPGLYDTQFDDVEEEMTAQVFLPFANQIEKVECRAELTTDPHTHPHLPDIQSYMKLWSRSCSFREFNDVEPVLNPSVCFESPTWYQTADWMADLDANNSWYFTNDYISFLSLIFLYYTGSMAYKVCVDPSAHPSGGYVYVSLGDPQITPISTIRQQTHCPFTTSSHLLPDLSNFGTGTAATPVNNQPVLEFSLPYRGENIWSYANECAYSRPFAPAHGFFMNATCKTNVVLNEDTVLADAVFRKCSPDLQFRLEVGLPPFTIWAARGYDWSVV